MAAKYHDYYKTLGVERAADQDEIKKAYRRLARKYHPDVNKDPSAADKFKEAAEAFEVLGDPEKRKRYDQLGSRWKAGQDFRPPPDWQNAHFEFHGSPREGGFSFADLGGGPSDFFETLFGGFQSAGAGRPRGRQWAMRGQDQESNISISLHDAYFGARKSIALQSAEMTPDGQVRPRLRNYDVTIPAGAENGTRIRLAGQGGPGVGEGPPGDLYLRVRIDPPPAFRLAGRDIETDLPVTPWEAALGARIAVKTVDKTLTLTVPPGTPSGRKLRLKGQGLPARGGKRAGDFLVTIQIRVPKRLDAEERRLFEELAKHSKFNPRA